MEGKKNQQPTSSFVTGAIALVFLIIGYEVALFVHKAAILRIAANRDHPDTVYVIERLQPEEEAPFVAKKRADAPQGAYSSGTQRIVRKEYSRPEAVVAVMVTSEFTMGYVDT